MTILEKTTSVTDLIDEVAGALQQLPDVDVRSVGVDLQVGNRSFDGIIEGQVKGHPVRFFVEARASAYPRDVREAIWQLANVRCFEHGGADMPLVAAPAISEASRALLREHKLGYWDAGGSLYVDLPWATYLIDRPVPVGRPRPLRNIFRGSSAQVLHALLNDPTRVWHIGELAKRAQVSASTVHQVCTFLEQQLWMEKEGRGALAVRLLREPGALLDAWAATHSLAEYEAYRYHRWTQSPDELLRAVTDALTSHVVEHALTLGSGANLSAPHATATDRLWVLVPESAIGRLDDAAGMAGLRRVEEGETVTFFVVHDRSPLLFKRKVGDFWVTSDVQLYLDLWGWPQRGKEQAKHLRAERLGY